MREVTMEAIMQKPMQQPDITNWRHVAEAKKNTCFQHRS